MTDRLQTYRKRFLEDWFSFNTAGLFLVICLLHIMLLLVKRTFIIDAIAAFEVLSETGEIWVFDIIYSIQYLSVPIILIWRITWTTLMLWIGSFLFGYRLLFNELWKLVLFTEIWFVFPEIIKAFWFIVVKTDPSYFEYVAFYPLSLMNLADFGTLQKELHYPFKAINLFEIGYWYILMVGVFFLSGKKWKTAIYIVLSTYVLFFFVWLLFYVSVY